MMKTIEFTQEEIRTILWDSIVKKHKLNYTEGYHFGSTAWKMEEGAVSVSITFDEDESCEY